MIIGVPKEVKDHETRVGLVPGSVHALREAGHQVLVETRAGVGSSIPDHEYAEAGIEYTILDDFHFKNAGLLPNQLHGYYVTEDDGRLLAVFPGSERQVEFAWDAEGVPTKISLRLDRFSLEQPLVSKP